MKRKYLTVLSAALTAAAFLLLVALPGDAADGARKGLGICAGVIVPSLFPFLVFSGLLSALGLPEASVQLLQPLFRRVRIHPHAAVPLLLGLLGGYPVGASTLAALVRDGLLSREEAERLLPCCNNTGPAFIIGAAGSAVFGSAAVGLGLYLCHILAAVTVLLLFGRSSVPAETAPSHTLPRQDFADAFPVCVRTAAASTVNICAFVVFFSVLTALLSAAGVFSALTAAVALHFGTELQFARALITGLLELGSGIASMSGLAPVPRNLALCAFLLGFGGFSVHSQTLSVLSGTKIRCARHFVGRILHGALSALYAYVLFTLLQI